MKQTTISRRELLANLSAGCMGLLAAGTLVGTAGCGRRADKAVTKGQVLSATQIELLRAMADVIIPETETPGAAAVGAHIFIDDQLANCRSPEEGAQFIRELDQAGTLIEAHWGATYPALADDDKVEAMTALAAAGAPFASLGKEFFGKLKRLTMLAYYSSEAGASEELVYLPVPGGYDGDFKLSDNNGRAFARHRY